jgi:hypothetical protein
LRVLLDRRTRFSIAVIEPPPPIGSADGGEMAKRKTVDQPAAIGRAGAPEVLEHHVGPVIRVFAGLMGLALIGAVTAAFLYRSHVDSTGLLVVLLVGIGFCWVAARGFRTAVIDPPPSERFTKLADPTRPLAPADFPPSSSAPHRQPPSSGGEP